MYREVIFLRYYEGYEVKEIAALLGRSPALVSTHLKRGKEKRYSARSSVMGITPFTEKTRQGGEICQENENFFRKRPCHLQRSGDLQP